MYTKNLRNTLVNARQISLTRVDKDDEDSHGKNVEAQ